MINKAFTLLEIIIVIIIIGVLASLALPRLFAMVEYSKAAEALSFMATIRSAVERCYLQQNGTYVGCEDWDAIGLDDQSSVPNSHFDYIFDRCQMFGTLGFCIQANRNNYENGDSEDKILIRLDNANRLYRCGYGLFDQLTDNNGPCPPASALP